METRQLADLISVGPATLKDFALLGVRSVAQLVDCDATQLYEKLCQKTRAKHDPCVIDVFAAAVAQARDPNLPLGKCKWWYWSKMRKWVIFTLLWFGGLCLFQPQFVQGKDNPKNIYEYYRELPEDLFICETPLKVTDEYRNKQMVRKNIASGYISAKAEGYPMEVALFKSGVQSGDIIAVNISCGAGCMCNRFMLLSQASDGKWSEVTTKLFPGEREIARAIIKAKSDYYHYVLPESGTTIKVVDGATSKVLLKIVWNGRKFEIK